MSESSAPRRRHGDGTVRQRSDGRWVARLRYVDPRTSRPRRAERYASTERAAWAALRELRREQPGELAVDGRMTVRSWAERWESSTLAASDRRPSTKATYRTLLRSLVLPELGDLRLRDVRPHHVEAWQLSLADRRAASTVRQAHHVLALLLDGAVRDGLLRDNPARTIRRARPQRREARWYSSEQVAALRAAAGEHRLAPLLELVAYTGLRKGEALGLRWSDVDLDAAELRVTGTLVRGRDGLERSEPKTDAGWRVVPLVPAAVAALVEQRQQQRHERLAAGPAWTQTGYVFTTELGTPVDPRNALRWFYTVRDAAGIGDGSWHTLRHSAATVLLTAGVPMPVVSAVLGHSSITVTVDMYGHVAPAVMADAMGAAMRAYGAADPQSDPQQVAQHAPTGRDA